MNKKQYLQKIINNFPKLKFSKSKLITSGFDDDVIILDQKIVFSFPKQKADCLDKFQKELKILPLLNKIITLPTPNFRYIPTDRSFAGYKYIEGVPLSNKVIKILTAKEKEACAKQIAKFLSELHSCSMHKAKKSGVTVAWSEPDARSHYTKRARIVFNKLGYDLQSLKKLLDRYPMNDLKKEAVVHQDFTSGHILFDIKTRKIKGIIDFGDLQIADPAIDFSKLWDYGEDFLDLVISFYKIRDDDLKERSLRWWIYHNINLVEFGYDKKIANMTKLGYKRLKKMMNF